MLSFALPGDFTADAHVDSLDFAVLAANFNKTHAQARTDGDADGSGGVDLTDFTWLAADFNRVVSPVPLTIGAGGTYGPGVFSAVLVSTTQPVTLVDSDVLGTVQCSGAVNLTLRGDVVRTSGVRALSSYGFASVAVENCSFIGASGIELGDSGGAVSILRNTATNIAGPVEHGNFVVLDHVSSSDGEIAFNRIINDQQHDQVEDCFSLYHSGGVQGHPLLIHDNYEDSPTANSGTMMLIGDHSTTEGWVECFNNVVASHGNTSVGLSIGGGHDQHIYSNRIFAVNSQGDGEVGGSVWNFTGTSSFARNTFTSNTVGWVRSDGTRNDFWLPDSSDSTGNVHYSGAINAALLAAEFARWNSLAPQKIGA